MAKDPYKYFRIEARELVDQLGKDVLALEHRRDPLVVARLLRLAHTLKGAARVVKHKEIADTAHLIEDALAPLRADGDDAAGAPRELIDKVLALLDRAASGLEQLAPKAAADSAPRAGAGAEPPPRTVRTDVAEVDAVLEGLSEAHAQLNALKRTLLATEQARHLVDLLVEQLARPGGGAVSGAGSGAGAKVRSTAEELRRIFAGLEQRLFANLDQMDRELTQVRELSEQLRLVPVSALFGYLERSARDTAQSLGKAVVFEGRGGAVRLDAQVVDGIQPALLQVIKNAVAHGLEPEPERRAAGKPVGRVVIEVARRGQEVAFRCSDDGRGVDIEAVRNAVLRRGLAPSAVQGLDAEGILRLLLDGGLTTAPTISEVSGRGIGLDVLREAVDRLQGRVSVHSEPGKGTTFEIVLPLALASVDALVVEARGATAAIPLHAVERTLRVRPSDLCTTARGESLVEGGEVVPFVSLSSLLGHASRAPAVSSASSVVLLQAGQRRAAIGVERLLGTRHVLVRPMPELAPADPVVSGAALDAEGNPRLVLSVEGLLAGAHAVSAVERAAAPPRASVLVIDDSLTTRMLEQSILESAGYEVDLATSGEEGLETARRKRYALFLVDVEMPGMDGFTFVERARADPTLREIPAILVTSRAAPEDRQRGREAGAQGYIVKSEFDQADLLSRIKRLVA